MNVQIEEGWKKALAPEFEKDYFVRLTDFVRQEYQQTTVYPPGRLIFNAFNLCPFDKESGDYRAGPVSWTRTSAWLVFFGERRGGISSFFAEYIQGNSR